MTRKTLNALKMIIQEAYEDACMECGYDEGIHEDEAVEEYLSEERESLKGLKKR